MRYSNAVCLFATRGAFKILLLTLVKEMLHSVKENLFKK